MTVWTVPAIVDRVVDGDSIHLVLDLGWHLTYAVLARVAHINAPELADKPAGPAARAHAAELLPPGTVVTFVSHSLDKYGRPLGDVLLTDGGDFGMLMIAAGHAVPYEGGPR